MGAIMKVATSDLNGRRVGRFDGLRTLGTDAVIDEAISHGHCVGKKGAILAMANGLLKSMIDGVSRDGDGRKIDGFMSINAFANGRLDDITDDFDRTKIGVSVSGRALKELQLDYSDWSFVIEGVVGNLNISTITTGEKLGEVVVGEAIDLNGWGLDLAGGGTVSWALKGTALAGVIPEAKLESTQTRITIAADALSELDRAEYNDMTIVFDIRNGNKRAIKSATLVVG